MYYTIGYWIAAVVCINALNQLTSSHDTHNHISAESIRFVAPQKNMGSGQHTLIFIVRHILFIIIT